MEPELQACDLVLVRGRSFWNQAIRLFTRSLGEDRSKVDHVAIVTEGGAFYDAILVQAFRMVVHESVATSYAGKDKQVAVYRPLNLGEAEMAKVAAKAESYVGRKYGFGKIVTHSLDWLLQGVYLFRRLNIRDDYPICSWVVAYAFLEAGKDFGVEPGRADPDDIWDFVTSRPDLYAQVRPLEKVPERPGS